MTTLREAAQARALGITQRSHRPSQRRGAEGGRSAGYGRWADITIRAKPVVDEGPSVIQFEGIASAYESPYEMYDIFGPYTEVVSAGAGAASLKTADLDVPLVLGHDQMKRIARTTNGSLSLREVGEGLRVRADLNPADADVSYILPKLEAGLIDEMSFAFRITAGTWSPDYSEFRINQYDIHRGDVAIVGFGANPATSATLRAEPSRGSRARVETMVKLALAR